MVEITYSSLQELLANIPQKKVKPKKINIRKTKIKNLPKKKRQVKPKLDIKEKILCEICNVYLSRCSMPYHLQSIRHFNILNVVKVIKPEFTCDLCNITTTKFYLQVHLGTKKHLLRIQPKIKETFYCSTCDYTTHIKFNFKIHLTSLKHINNNVPQPPKIYKCVPCNFQATCKTRYKNHIGTEKHSRNGTRKNFNYYCKVCDLNITRPSQVRRHNNTIGHNEKLNKIIS